MRKLLTFIRDLVIRNWALKILAVLLGSLSFFTIRGAISFEVPYSIPISVEVPPGMAVLDKSMAQVNVTFRGSQESLRRLDQTQIKAIVRPRETDPGGSETVSIRPQDVVGANDVRVVSIRPASIRVSYDWEAERDVVVLKPKAIGSPLFGRVEIDHDPKAVRLRGPRRRLRNISAVSCEPVDVDGRVESFTRQSRILSPGDAWVYDIEPPEVTVRVNIVTELVTRRFEDVPILAVTQPGTMFMVELDPPVVNMSVVGRSDAIENLAPESVSVYVNCAGLTPGAGYELPVQFYLPSETDLEASTEPAVVRARITEK